MRNRRTSRGLSLAELIISLTILVVVLVFCSMLFVTSWRRFQMTSAMQDAQNSATMGLDHFTRDFEETSVFNIHNYTTTTGAGYIFFPSPRDKEGTFHCYPTGDPQWMTWVIYYLYPDPGAAGLFLLARKRVDWNPLMPPTASDTSNLDHAAIMGRGVQTFTVERKSDDPTNYHFYSARIATRRYYRDVHYDFNTYRSYVFNDLLKR